MTIKEFDVIIIGGSYAGLSAALALGRSLRKVLIIDGGEPCNRQTPHSHNMLTLDGMEPARINEIAMDQVLKYRTVQLYRGVVITAEKNADLFNVNTSAGDQFTARRIILATGLKDIMPSIPGFAECWGISVLHCPYCHGYEVNGRSLGVFGNGDMGFEFAKLIHHWSQNLTLFTNGVSTLKEEQLVKLEKHGIVVDEREIHSLVHENGNLNEIVFSGNSRMAIEAIFARVPFQQTSSIPTDLGCSLSGEGLIVVNEFQQTSVGGIYAAGDATTMLRALSQAIASGTKAGAILNKELIDADF